MKRKALWLIGIAFLANVILLVTEQPLLRYPAAILLLYLLPGLALVELLPGGDETDPVERLVLGIGASYVFSGVVTLLLHYLPGPLGFFPLLIACDLAILLPLLALRSRNPVSGGSQGSSFQLSVSSFQFPVSKLGLLLLLALAAFFRLTYLGYAEFQGDEGKLLLRAAQIIVGDERAIFQHHKGPVEMLLPTATWLLTGRINEWQARLPFTLLNLVGIAAVYLVGRQARGELVGLVAGALLAINGFFVGFGRIVQYQSVVFAMTALGIWCFYRFRESQYMENFAPGGSAPRQTDRSQTGQEQEFISPTAYLLLGAIFLAFGVLAHYDAVTAAPVMAYLWWTGVRRARERSGMGIWIPALRTAVLALLLGGGILALFYIPYIRDPYFAEVYSYLRGTRVGGGVLHNNLGEFFITSTIYNSTYYVVFLALALVVLLVARLGRRRVLLSLLLLSAVALVLLFPERWRIGEIDLAFLPFLLAILAFFAVSDETLRVFLIWFAAPCLFYLFVVDYPLTHVYNLYPGWALLTGVALAEGWHFLRQRRNTAILTIAGGLSAVLFLLFAYYTYFVFVDHTPEYKRTYPAHRNPLYWTAYDELPPFGYFGFPYRAGWKVIGQLYRDGVLQGDYGSNEEEEITGWYTGNARRSYCRRPTYYFIAVNVQDEQPVFWDELEQMYAPIGVVTVGGEPKLTIYRKGAAAGEPTVYRVEDYEPRFDAGTVPAALFRREEFTGYTPLRANLGNKVLLLGYELDTQQVAPGDTVELVLYWQALTRMEVSYHVFTHVETDRIWGQCDQVPNCEHYPTTDWQPGEIVPDRYVIPIAPETPPGEYPLLVGMYELESLQRLPVLDAAGNPVGDSVRVVNLVVGRTRAAGEGE